MVLKLWSKNSPAHFLFSLAPFSHLTPLPLIYPCDSNLPLPFSLSVNWKPNPSTSLLPPASLHQRTQPDITLRPPIKIVIPFLRSLCKSEQGHLVLVAVHNNKAAQFVLFVRPRWCSVLSQELSTSNVPMSSSSSPIDLLYGKRLHLRRLRLRHNLLSPWGPSLLHFPNGSPPSGYSSLTLVFDCSLSLPRPPKGNHGRVTLQTSKVFSTFCCC